MKFASGVALISTENQRHASTSAVVLTGASRLARRIAVEQAVRAAGIEPPSFTMLNQSQDDSNGAAEAGMSPGNLYCYFRSKEALVAGIDERVPITKRRIESLIASACERN
jgi:Bacterial regulatory proteins, tetR family